MDFALRGLLLPMTTWLLWLPKLGVLDVDPAKVVTKGRLQPGKMFVVDLEQGRIVSDDELKEEICNSSALWTMAKR
jgi:hypothetical protein